MIFNCIVCSSIGFSVPYINFFVSRKPLTLILLQTSLTYFYQQVRKNKFVEILPINVGCLGACTYCKTKHARGHLGSYTVESLVGDLSDI